MDEFELIRRFFDRPVTTPGVVTGIGDDGTVLTPPPGRDQVQVIDTLVEGVHFPAGTSAADIGYRVVAVNLSDVAAMGANPRWMTLALTLPQADDRWVADFADGLFEAAKEFDVALVGGDMTRGDKVVATVHITADVEAGKALLRSQAKVGDAVFVTGTLGDAAAGLALLRRGEFDAFLVGRFLRPNARIAIGRQLVGRASSAIDISDGLVGDLTKLLAASGVGGELEVERLPMSDAIKARFDDAQRTRLALTGGDDYELCFTAQPDAVKGIDDVTAIGRITDGAGLTCRNDGVVVEYDDCGYRHFLNKRPQQDDRNLVRTVLTDPVNFLAFGLGTGLAPFAPGTFGSIPGVMLFWLTLDFGLYVQLGIAAALALSGVWICGESARRIGVHDHGGIVWDEITGMYLTLLAAPFTPTGWLLAFVLFRIMDIVKPWPIRDLDHRLGGGVGIMLDDLVAALYAAVVLGLYRWLMI